MGAQRDRPEADDPPAPDADRDDDGVGRSVLRPGDARLPAEAEVESLESVRSQMGAQALRPDRRGGFEGPHVCSLSTRSNFRRGGSPAPDAVQRRIRRCDAAIVDHAAWQASCSIPQTGRLRRRQPSPGISRNSSADAVRRCASSSMAVPRAVECETSSSRRANALAARRPPALGFLGLCATPRCRYLSAVGARVDEQSACGCATMTDRRNAARVRAIKRRRTAGRATGRIGASTNVRTPAIAMPTSRSLTRRLRLASYGPTPSLAS